MREKSGPVPRRSSAAERWRFNMKREMQAKANPKQVINNE